ncbi:hypothetical protein Droror1_Dr00022670 [Drosera rotundifolia]
MTTTATATVMCTAAMAIPPSQFSHYTDTKPFNWNPTALNPHRHLLLSRFPNRRFSVDEIRSPARRRRRRGHGVVARAAGSERRVMDERVRRVVQVGLWVMEGVYVFWLFFLPFAPGDPVWAISSETISSLLGLSLNFFFILPAVNSVGFHLMEAQVLHPMSEGLFNFVVAWTLMFAPVLYTDWRRDRYTGSLDVLWGFQMFLTNTVLIPYMAIRLNEADPENSNSKPSKLGSLMFNGAPVVGLIGGAVSIVSILWAIYGRGDGDFGSVSERWEFLISYLGSERLAYAFIWDIVLYTVFQPWLIIDNLQNVRRSRVGIVKYLGFVPVLGLVAYLLCLDKEDEQ